MAAVGAKRGQRSVFRRSESTELLQSLDLGAYQEIKGSLKVQQSVRALKLWKNDRGKFEEQYKLQKSTSAGKLRILRSRDLEVLQEVRDFTRKTSVWESEVKRLSTPRRASGPLGMHKGRAEASTDTSTEGDTSTEDAAS